MTNDRFIKAQKDFPIGATVIHLLLHGRIGVVVGYNYDNHPILVRWHNEEQPTHTFEYESKDLKKVHSKL